jgi:hypothetical protein
MKCNINPTIEINRADNLKINQIFPAALSIPY